MVVVVRSQSSELQDITAGVRQCSVRGLIIFSCFINDFPSIIRSEVGCSLMIAQGSAPFVTRQLLTQSVGELILKTVAECSVRSGMSLQAIKKALRVKGVDVEKGKFQIKQSIKRLVAKDFLVQTKGTGASGTFKIAKQEKKGNVVKKIKTGAAKRSLVKKTAAKKLITKKTAKKSPGKKIVAKKVSNKKTAAKKVSTKKAATPKKAVKKATLPKKSPAKNAKKAKRATGGKPPKKVQSSRGGKKPKAAKAQKAALRKK
ncbi:histone H1-like [Heterodontus francisci]|uniref:histone H1-like n=1 Tax=Heterodontus francisci TaxID=7792 RepID=UPI00355AD32C